MNRDEGDAEDKEKDSFLLSTLHPLHPCRILLWEQKTLKILFDKVD
jgi:hypothetical protein